MSGPTILQYRVLVSKDPETGSVVADAHGRHKAVFFGRFGFTRERWQELASALRHHAEIHDVGTVEETPFGTRYAVEGHLSTPGGRVVRVRTVWYVERGEDFPRFVTAYPLEAGR